MESNLQVVPPLANSANIPGSENQKVAKKKNQEIDFISQFLELPIVQHSQHQQSEEDFAENKQRSVFTSDTIERSSSNMENPIREPKLKSIFHNFQKHLVVTLKSSIKFKSSHKRDPVLNLAYKMWKVFTDSHLCCKKILHFLFGVVNLTPEENYLEIRNYGISGSEDLLLSHSIEQVKAAQQSLRSEVIRQGYKLVEKDGLSQRRMQKNDEFESYFLSFLEQLQSGSLNRRLPKSEKLQIIRQIKKIQEDNM